MIYVIRSIVFFQLKVKNTGTSHLVIGKGQVKLTSETAIKAKDQESKNTSIIEKQMSDLNVNNQIGKNFLKLCQSIRFFCLLICTIGTKVIRYQI